MGRMTPPSSGQAELAGLEHGAKAAIMGQAAVDHGDAHRTAQATVDLGDARVAGLNLGDARVAGLDLAGDARVLEEGKTLLSNMDDSPMFPIVSVCRFPLVPSAVTQRTPRPRLLGPSALADP